MRVLFLAPRRHSNLNGFLEGLRRVGVEARMLVIGAGATERTDQTEVVRLRLASWQPFVGESEQRDFAKFAQRALPHVGHLWREIWTFKPDFVVCRGLTSLYILAALPLILLISKPVLYTQGPRERTWRLARWLTNTALLTIVGGRWYTPVQRRGALAGVVWTDRRISFVPFALEPAPAAANRTWRSDRLRVLAVGKYETRKNHEALLRALSLSPPALRLTIVGEASTEVHLAHLAKLKDLVRELKLGRRVELEVNVPNSKMPELYLSHDLYVQMSSNEPASVSQLEAMAHGLGVIINPDNGTASYVTPGESGFFCPPEPHAIASVLTTISEDAGLVARIGLASYRTVAERYRPEHVAKEFLEVLNS